MVTSTVELTQVVQEVAGAEWLSEGGHPRASAPMWVLLASVGPSAEGGGGLPVASP